MSQSAHSNENGGIFLAHFCRNYEQYDGNSFKSKILIVNITMNIIKMMMMTIMSVVLMTGKIMYYHDSDDDNDGDNYNLLQF